MTHLVDTLNTVLLDAATEPWVPLALLLCCLVDGFFPPVPSESLVIGLAAVAAASGAPSLWLVLLAGAAGAVLGDLTAYGLGRRVGTRGFAWMRTPRMARLTARAERTLRRRGALVVITGRFVPVGRVVINVTAGATGLPLRRYLPLCLTAGTAWAGFGVTVGWLGGAWMHDHPVLGVAVAIALGIVLGGLVDRLAQRLTSAPADDEPYAEAPAGADRSPDMIGR